MFSICLCFQVFALTLLSSLSFHALVCSSVCVAGVVVGVLLLSCLHAFVLTFEVVVFGVFMFCCFTRSTRSAQVCSDYLEHIRSTVLGILGVVLGVCTWRRVLRVLGVCWSAIKKVAIFTENYDCLWISLFPTNKIVGGHFQNVFSPKAPSTRSH